MRLRGEIRSHCTMLDMNAGVIGYPVDHSLSPRIHNAVYQAMGIPWSYGLLPAPTGEDVERIVREGRSKALLASSPDDAMAGFNVTTPHKRKAYELADRMNVSSFVVGGANTLTFSEECSDAGCGYVLSCDTTDGEGACRALEHSGAQVEGAGILILGTGAAAMSIMVSAIMRGAGKVNVASRDAEKARGTVSGILSRADEAGAEGLLGCWGFGDDARAVDWQPLDAADIVIGYDAAPEVSRAADIVVNATPVGMKPGDGSPLPEGSFRRGQLVMDAVYAHGLTKIRSDAEAAGAKAIDGLAMLVEQALLSMAIWLSVAGYDFSTRDPDVYRILGDAGISVPAPGRDA